MFGSPSNKDLHGTFSFFIGKEKTSLGQCKCKFKFL
jgi:hypothetical protein